MQTTDTFRFVHAIHIVSALLQHVSYHVHITCISTVLDVSDGVGLKPETTAQEGGSTCASAKPLDIFFK